MADENVYQKPSEHEISPLAILGGAATLTAASIFGVHAAKYVKNYQKAAESASVVAKSAEAKVRAQSKETFSRKRFASNIADTMFDDLRLKNIPTEMINVEFINGMPRLKIRSTLISNIQRFLSKEDIEAFQNLIQTLANRIGTSFQVGVHFNNLGIPVSATAMFGTHKVSLGNFAINGQIMHATSGAKFRHIYTGQTFTDLQTYSMYNPLDIIVEDSRNTFATRFVSPKGVEAITRGNVPNLRELLKQEVMSYNRARFFLIQQAIQSPEFNSIYGLESIITDIDQSLRQIVREGIRNPAKIEAIRKGISPLLINPKNWTLKELSVYDPTIQQYALNFDKLVGETADYITHHTFGQSKSNYGIGIFSHPFEEQTLSEIIKDLTDKIPQGEHPLYQAFTREAVPLKQMNSLFQKMPAEVKALIQYTNTMPIGFYSVPQSDEYEFALFNKLAQLGIGNAGLPIAPMPKEGLMISRQWLRKRFMLPEVLDIPFAEEGIAEVDQNLDWLLNYIVSHSVNSEKLQTQLTSNKSIQRLLSEKNDLQYINNILLNKATGASKAQMKQALQFRNQMIHALSSEGLMETVLEDIAKNIGLRGGLDIKALYQHIYKTYQHGAKVKLPNVITLAKLPSKHITLELKKPGRQILKNIRLTEKGLRFEIARNYSFLQANTKVWGTMKSIGLRVAKNPRELVFAHMMAKLGYLPSEIINSGNIKQIREILRALKEKYMDIYKIIPKDVTVTHDFIRSSIVEGKGKGTLAELSALIGEHIIKNNPELQEILEKILYHEPGTKNTSQLGFGLFSVSPPYDYYGSNPKTSHAINSLWVDRLLGAGFTKTAGILEDMFDKETFYLMYKTFAPMFNPSLIPKDALVVDLDKLSISSVTKLTSGFLDESIEEANRIAKALFNIDKISPTTTFLVRHAETTANGAVQYRYTPIPLFESGYTSTFNEFHFVEQGQPIRKLINQKLFAALRHEKEGDFETAARLYQEARGIVAKIMFDKNIYMTVPPPRNKAFVYSYPLQDVGLLDKEYLTGALGLSEETLEKILSRHGLTLEELQSGRTIGLPENIYKRFAKYLGYTKDQQIETPFVIAGRLPLYTHEGATVSKFYNISELVGDIAHAYYSAQSKTKRFNLKTFLEYIKMLRNMKQSILPDRIYASRALMAASASDLDRDELMLILFKNAEKRAILEEEVKANTPVLDRIFYEGGKGGIGKVEHEFNTLVEAAYTEMHAIPQFYNAAIIYQEPLTPLSKLVSGTEEEIRAKVAAINQFFTSLPERAIGGKRVATIDEMNNIMNIFNTNMKMEQRVSLLRQYMQADQPEGFVKIVESITDKELERVLQHGDQIPDVIRVLATRSVSARNIEDVIALLNSRGLTATEESANAFLRFIDASVPKSRSLNTAGKMASDISESTIPKMLKSKTLWLAVGASAAMAMAYGDEMSVRLQEAREVSRPENFESIPAGAEPIDPPKAYVAKPRPKNYRYYVRGDIPSYINPAYLNTEFQNAGFSNTYTYINQSKQLDYSYVQELNDEHKLNSWQR